MQRGLSFLARTRAIPSILRRGNRTTAGCLVIGNEILNGTVKEANLHPLAQALYERGLHLKCAEVIGDDEEVIHEAIQRMRSSVDYLFTTGGIGSTHDDITYSAIAKSYQTPLRDDHDTEYLLECGLKRRGMAMTEERRKMCIFPSSAVVHRTPVAQQMLAQRGSSVEFDSKNAKNTFWVPLVVMDRCFIFPGVPHIFRSMLEDFESVLPRSTQEKLFRKDLYIRLGEGEIALCLYEVEKKFAGDTSPLQIGSYPERIGEDEKYQVRVSLQSASADILQQGEEALLAHYPFRDTPFGEVLV